MRTGNSELHSECGLEHTSHVVFFFFYKKYLKRSAIYLRTHDAMTTFYNSSMNCSLLGIRLKREAPEYQILDSCFISLSRFVFVFQEFDSNCG